MPAMPPLPSQPTDTGGFSIKEPQAIASLITSLENMGFEPGMYYLFSFCEILLNMVELLFFFWLS